jgi:ribosome-binding protein aMBF1 (putative translation factor)
VRSFRFGSWIVVVYRTPLPARVVPIRGPLAADFPDKVRRGRLDRGWSQADLAMTLGVSLRIVQLWEAGEVSKPHPSSIRRLAHAFGRDVSWFYDNRRAA